jgi:hypothetical protein
MMPRRKMRPPIGGERAVGSRSGAHEVTCRKIIPFGIWRANGVKANRNDPHGDSARSSNGRRIGGRAARRTPTAAWGTRPKVAPM